MQVRLRGVALVLLLLVAAAGVWCAVASHAHDPGRMAVVGGESLCTFTGTRLFQPSVPTGETFLPSAHVVPSPDFILPQGRPMAIFHPPETIS
jgi:hypothetical protein